MSTAPDVAVEEMTRGMSMISLKSILPNAEGVRVANINGMPYMSIRDLIMAICGKNGNDAGAVWRNLPDKFKNEVQQQFVLNFQFPGRGQSLQPVITLQGLVRLIAWLPGDLAKEKQNEVCDLVARFLAGDQTLHAAIDENAASTAPLNVMARASLPHPAVMVAPAAKRAYLALPQSALQAAYDARDESIRNAIIQYQELNGGVLDPDAKAAFSKMLLMNTQALIETPLALATDKSKTKKGFIYCFQSTGQPDFVKIGRTTATIKQRLHQVNYTRKIEGINDPLLYKHAVNTLNVDRDEKLAHEHFAAVRVSGRGELFRTTPESVRDFLDSVIKPRYLLESGSPDCDPVDMDMDIDTCDEDDASVAMPVDVPMHVPAGELNDELKAFVVSHLMYCEGSFVASCEIREVFLRHTGTNPTLFSTTGVGPFKQLGMWLNSAIDKNKDTLLIQGAYCKQKQIPYLKKTAQAYINLAWKDGPIADVVRDARLALASGVRGDS